MLDKNQSTEHWKNYWRSYPLAGASFDTSIGSETYRIPTFLLLKRIIKDNGLRVILSAGSGQDIIGFNLQKFFNNDLQLTLLDVSPEVLGWNRKLFTAYNLTLKTAEGNIFNMPFADGTFDLVFNTGVLEHFEEVEQTAMVKEIMRILRPGGYFITANPSDNGGIYKWGMEAAKKKGVWPYGREIPIASLDFLRKEIHEIDFIEEYQKDFLGQLRFLSYVSPILKYPTFPFRLLGRYIFFHQICDIIFSKILGTYLIISIIAKKEL